MRVAMLRVGAEANFGRGDLGVCPLGYVAGARGRLISTPGGRPPGVTTGTKTEGASPYGNFCASVNGELTPLPPVALSRKPACLGWLP